MFFVNELLWQYFILYSSIYNAYMYIGLEGVYLHMNIRQKSFKCSNQEPYLSTKYSCCYHLKETQCHTGQGGVGF